MRLPQTPAEHYLAAKNEWRDLLDSGELRKRAGHEAERLAVAVFDMLRLAERETIHWASRVEELQIDLEAAQQELEILRSDKASDSVI